MSSQEAQDDLEEQQEVEIEDEDENEEQQEVEIEDEGENDQPSWYRHSTKSMRIVSKGKLKGKDVEHFCCKYCDSAYQGPSISALLKHVKVAHPKKCPDLLPQSKNFRKSTRGFFDKAKTKMPFNEDIFSAKLLKWIVQTDQPFSIVNNHYFKDVMEYLKQDISIKSRRSIMRRLEEVYDNY
jgi:hypothetical protein